MSDIKLNIQGLETFQKDVYAGSKGVQREVKKAMVSSVNAIKNHAQDHVVYKTGNLRRSIQTMVENPFKGVVYQDSNVAPYGKYIEYGTGEFVGRSKWLGNIPGVGWRWIKGMAAKPFMRPALEANVDRVKNYFEDAVTNVIHIMAGKK